FPACPSPVPSTSSVPVTAPPRVSSAASVPARRLFKLPASAVSSRRSRSNNSASQALQRRNRYASGYVGKGDLRLSQRISITMLPSFRYHPAPLATGSVVESATTCRCCGRARGYIYASSVYAVESLRDSLCPWCIADGSAATKFDACFSDGDPLIRAGVPVSVVDEVTLRTPGYVSWQQEVWLACCDDACAFHGDATRSELSALDRNALAEQLAEWGIDIGF